MFSIVNNKIVLTRGDSTAFKVTLRVLGSKTIYNMTGADELLFTVRDKSSGDSVVVLQKSVIGNNIVELIPSDTCDLRIGRYTYDVQVTLSTGEVCTVVEPNVFELTKEVS